MLRQLHRAVKQQDTYEDKEGVDVFPAVFDLVDVRLADGPVQRRPPWSWRVRNLDVEAFSNPSCTNALLGHTASVRSRPLSIEFDAGSSGRSGSSGSVGAG